MLVTGEEVVLVTGEEEEVPGLGLRGTLIGTGLPDTCAGLAIEEEEGEGTFIGVGEVAIGSGEELEGAGLGEEVLEGPGVGLEEVEFAGLGAGPGEVTLAGLGVGLGEVEFAGLGAGLGEVALAGLGVGLGEVEFPGLGAGLGEVALEGPGAGAVPEPIQTHASQLLRKANRHCGIGGTSLEQVGICAQTHMLY